MSVQILDICSLCRGKKYGETANECGEAFFFYGKSLLELARYVFQATGFLFFVFWLKIIYLRKSEWRRVGGGGLVEGEEESP